MMFGTLDEKRTVTSENVFHDMCTQQPRRGVVGCGEGVVYLTSSGRPTYWLTVGQGLLSLKQVKIKGGGGYFFCFFPFIPVPLSSLLFHLLYYFLYLFSPFLWETAQNDPQR